MIIDAKINKCKKITSVLTFLLLPKTEAFKVRCVWIISLQIGC